MDLEAAQAGIAMPVDSFLLGDAIRAAFSINPNILLADQTVEFNKGLLTTQSGKFDTLLQANISRNETYNLLSSFTRNTYPYNLIGANKDIVQSETYAVGLQTMFRNGVIFQPQASLTKSTDDLYRQYFSQQAQNTTSIGFSITIPMLKNSGAVTVAAQEKAAEIELEASRLDLSFAISQTILSVTNDYWNYRAAWQTLAIAKASENRVKQMLSDLQKLIDRDQIAASELNLALANLADKQITTISAEQAFIQARNVLSRAIGLNLNQANLLPSPSQAFPNIALEAENLPDKAMKLWRTALDKRSDLLANEQRNYEAQVLNDALRHNLLPQLDAKIIANWVGLAEGSISKGIDKVINPDYGPTLGVNITYGFPLENRVATGQTISQSAVLAKSLINIKNLHDNIIVNIDTYTHAVQHSAAQAKASDTAVDIYTKALKDEIKKQKLGMATVLDVVQVNDRLLNAQYNQIQQHQNYAIALAQLRFEIGDLMQSNQYVYNFLFDLNMLESIPD